MPQKQVTSSVKSLQERHKSEQEGAIGIDLSTAYDILIRAYARTHKHMQVKKDRNEQER